LLLPGCAQGEQTKKPLGITIETSHLADSKSDAEKSVAGSNPVPSALENKAKNDEKSPGNRAFFMRRRKTAE
jgi:hypothetical protein